MPLEMNIDKNEDSHNYQSIYNVMSDLKKLGVDITDVEGGLGINHRALGWGLEITGESIKDGDQLFKQLAMYRNNIRATIRESNSVKRFIDEFKPCTVNR